MAAATGAVTEPGGHRGPAEHHELPPSHFGWTRTPRLVDFWDLLADPDSRIPFAKIVSAHWLTLSRPELREEAYAAELAMRRRFERQQGRIQSSYFCSRTAGGCVLVERALHDKRGTVSKLFSSVRSDSADLVLLLGQCENIVDDAAVAFARADSSQLWRIREVSEAAYATATRALSAADTWVRTEDAAVRRAAVIGVQAAFDTTRQEADVMLQREVRFRYFLGVQLGAALALALCVLVGWVNATQWSGVVNTAALTAATVFGVLGAVASVFQRTASGNLIVDYRSPRWQTMTIGGLRPFVGAVLGLVTQFALVAIILSNPQVSGVSSTSFGFFALVGFVAGFSERFATDMIERAGRLLVAKDEPKTPDPPAAH